MHPADPIFLFREVHVRSKPNWHSGVYGERKVLAKSVRKIASLLDRQAYMYMDLIRDTFLYRVEEGSSKEKLHVG